VTNPSIGVIQYEWNIPIGTEVLDIEGESVGKVSSYDGFNLIVTSGLLLLHDYEVPMSLISSFTDGKLWLTCRKDVITSS
jgi:hypothetical protein